MFAATPIRPEATNMTTPIRKQLDANRRWLKERLDGNFDVVIQDIEHRGKTTAFVLYIEGMADSEAISDHVMAPLMRQEWNHISASQKSETGDFETVLDAVFAGNGAVFFEDADKAVIVNVRGGTRRGVEEPNSEAVIRGPREGFNENLRTNTALVRFKIKSPKLKMESFTIGTETRTQVVLAYMDNLIDPGVLREVRERIRKINIDGILESGYIEESIEDDTFSPFPQFQYTERPDTAAAQLLEGRFAIFVDGSPFVLMAPVTLMQLLQASEDYYDRFMIGSMIRILRIVFMLLALYLPGVYVAIMTYHQDMIPTNLLLSIAAAREAIPFPTIVEALIMEVSFEALREASIRLPRTIGQAVSILGALVVGQAAVEAGIVSAPMVIIVSLTGIASFSIPRFNLAITMRMLRFPMMIMAGIFGLLGIVVGMVLITTHLSRLRSFGVPYLSGLAPASPKDHHDLFFRLSWRKQTSRNHAIAHRNRKRMGGPSNWGPEGSWP
jgi:spore germination protein KA